MVVVFIFKFCVLLVRSEWPWRSHLYGCLVYLLWNDCPQSSCYATVHQRTFVMDSMYILSIIMSMVMNQRETREGLRGNYWIGWPASWSGAQWTLVKENWFLSIDVLQDGSLNVLLDHRISATLRQTAEFLSTGTITDASPHVPIAAGVSWCIG